MKKGKDQQVGLGCQEHQADIGSLLRSGVECLYVRERGCISEPESVYFLQAF